MNTRVLIIDDEADLCRLVKANLERLGGYEVLIATDPRDGLKAAARHRPDLILLDLVMPGMAGLDVLRALKDDPATIAIPVLMLTALGDEASRDRARGLYDDDYLVKPIPIEQLKARIDQVLQRLRPR